MKRFKIYLSIFSSLLFLNSCELNELDNYPAPNATISGGVYDKETGELIEQDIIRGSQIEYVEQGFSNPENQYMVIKNDGTYQNKLMFANTYTVQLVRGNFVNMEKQEVVVSGDTKLDFQVQPYIRIKNVSIVKEGNKIKASFNIQQTIGNNVNRIALFAHQEPNVGDPLHVVASRQNINAVTSETTLYTLEIDLQANQNNLKPGRDYYFRVGALMNAPEAKFNYAPAIRITL
jgi:hypothetical protein